MKLHDLQPDKGSRKKRTRVGRGIAAGKGKTAGRGQKGQGARGGKSKGQSFEGGQLSIVRRLPFKRGFNNIFRIEYQEVNVGKLAQLADGTVVTPLLLAEKRLIRDAEKPVVILGDGDLSKKLTVQTHRISKSAQEKITAAGGTVEITPLKVTGARATIKKLSKKRIAYLEMRQQNKK
jgi:large subunit ribosomal protein L15